jgi:MFS family permease
MNWLGRVRAIALGSIIIIVGGLLEILPRTLLWLQIGRFLVGFGVVFVTTAAPTYVVEIAHPIFRGRAGAAYNTGWSVGSIPAAVLCWGMAYVDNDWAWILPLMVQCCFSGVVLAGCLVIPESPRWLMSKGRTEEARAFFVKYHADGNASDPIIDKQMQDFEEAMNAEATSVSLTFYDLFKTKILRYQMLILLCVAFYTQYAGNYVNGYFVRETFLTSILTFFFLHCIVDPIAALFWSRCREQGPNAHV